VELCDYDEHVSLVQVLHPRVGSWPYPQTLDQAEKTYQVKHSSLLRKFQNYGQKKFYIIGPWSQRPIPKICAGILQTFLRQS
jgi:hypothetical protein